MYAIIVDLDGTLADINHRRHHAEAGDFDSFYKGIPEDKVNLWCKILIEEMRSRADIIIVSGREGTPEVMRDTHFWLFKHGIKFDVLYMRNEKDYRPDFVIKQEIYEKYIKDKHDILFVIDDRNSVVSMWRKLGLTVLQCAEGDF